MIIDKNTIFCEIRKFTVNHFGKNPINGGIPPNERKFIMKIIFNGLFEFKVLISCLIWKIFRVFKIIIILKEINL